MSAPEALVPLSQLGSKRQHYAEHPLVNPSQQLQGQADNAPNSHVS